jgi:1-phosphofructokinase family hexose kinase
VLRALLNEQGIPHRLVTIREPTIGVVEMNMDGEPHRRLQSDPPPVSRHEADDLYSVASLLVMESDVVILTGSTAPGMPADFFARMIRHANQLGVPTVVDVAPEHLASVLEAGPTIIKPNINQLSAFMPLTPSPTIVDLRVITERLQQQGARTVILSLGKDGAVMAVDNRFLRAQPPNVQPLGEAGAGDSMVAALAAGLVRGYNPEELLRLGVAAGSANVLRRGMGTFRPEVALQLEQWVQVEQLT